MTNPGSGDFSVDFSFSFGGQQSIISDFLIPAEFALAQNDQLPTSCRVKNLVIGARNWEKAFGGDRTLDLTPPSAFSGGLHHQKMR